MTTITFSGTSRTDSISSPFYDYGSDTLYVGDASGGLHKFHPAFNGTSGMPPAEIGTPWVAVSTTALSSPVHDAASGLVFVGDASGYLYSVNSSGTVIKSVQVATGSGIVDGPLGRLQRRAGVCLCIQRHEWGRLAKCLRRPRHGCFGMQRRDSLSRQLHRLDAIHRVGDRRQLHGNPLYRRL